MMTHFTLLRLPQWHKEVLWEFVRHEGHQAWSIWHRVYVCVFEQAIYQAPLKKVECSLRTAEVGNINESDGSEDYQPIWSIKK